MLGPAAEGWLSRSRMNNLEFVDPTREIKPAMTRAVIYARYSTDLQSAASVEDQVRICGELIARNVWSMVKVFQDRALSGASSLRPGYQALLAGARNGEFDVVVAEALDRLSRDQEDVAGLFKRLRYAGIRIVTLAEGEVSELHVGLKGTMNALFLRDLAAKTHRGLRGRVEAGKSGGGVTYGYQVVRRIGTDGTPIVGERRIDEAQAAIVLRVFEAYAAGDSPKKIALGLNATQVPAPRGGAWSGSTINGNRTRGTGILNNELYIGRLVWNRLAYMKDPETGRRRSRPHEDGEVIVTEVPELRIVPQALWEAARHRQRKLDDQARCAGSGTAATAAFWSKQRPRYLFSGLLRCGVCGSGFSKISATHFGCSGARNKGPTACTNGRTIKRDVLENTVLDGLRQRLMDPISYQTFAKEFTAEWNRLQMAATGDHAARAAELDKTVRQIERMVDAIANGTAAAAISAKLNALEQRRLALEAEIATSTAPAPYLHPNLADLYRQRVADLAVALQSDAAAEARELIRGLIDTITLHPNGAGQRIEIRGELSAILGIVSNRPCGSAPDLAGQIKLVAGIGFEPMTFRL